MRGDTPHDVPTHLLKNADSYITKSGAFLRRTSLDELPQIYNIVAGQMSIIGPRPALYNQYDLIAARDAVHANDIRPGLTGLAQINGRDELPIDVKARYDGEYAADITFLNDAKIFLHSITYVFQRRGVVEGGTGTMQQAENAKKSRNNPRFGNLTKWKTTAKPTYFAKKSKLTKKILSFSLKYVAKVNLIV